MKSIPEKCVILIYYWVPSTEQDILTLPEHLMSPPVFFVVVHTVSASVFVSSCSCAFIFCDLVFFVPLIFVVFVCVISILPCLRILLVFLIIPLPCSFGILLPIFYYWYVNFIKKITSAFYIQK
jgi:hypothetical protein